MKLEKSFFSLISSVIVVFGTAGVNQLSCSAMNVHNPNGTIKILQLPPPRQVRNLFTEPERILCTYEGDTYTFILDSEYNIVNEITKYIAENNKVGWESFWESKKDILSKQNKELLKEFKESIDKFFNYKGPKYWLDFSSNILVEYDKIHSLNKSLTEEEEFTRVLHVFYYFNNIYNRCNVLMMPNIPMSKPELSSKPTFPSFVVEKPKKGSKSIDISFPFF